MSDAGTARAVPFTTVWDEYVSGPYLDGAFPPRCGMAYPGECAPTFTGYMDFTGDWVGRATYVGQVTYNTTSQRLEDYYDPVTFTGTLGACGGGTISVTLRGHADPLPGATGWHYNITMAMKPGTASAGLAGVTDILGWVDGYLHENEGLRFPTKGTVWCR